MNTTNALDSTNFTTTITGANCRIKHVGLNAYPISNLVMFYANRLSDTVANNSITVVAAIEYPAGVYTRVTFGGNSSVTISAGQTDVASDPVGVTIPAGATYYERTFVSFALGKGCPFQHVRQLAVANGDAFSSSNGETDQTLSAMTPSANAWMYGAVAITGNTPAPFAIGIIGDSIASAGGDDQTGMFVAWPERGVAGQYGTVNVGQSSETAGQFIASHKGRMGLLRRCGLTHVLNEYATNDVSGGSSAATTLSAIAFINSLCVASGMNPSNSTIIPRTTTTDSWATAANQTPQTNFAIGGVADTYNTNILATPPQFANTVFDINHVLEDQSNKRKWITNGTANFYTTDGVHPNATSAPVAAGAFVVGNMGAAGFAAPVEFTQGSFYLHPNDIGGVADGSGISTWKDRIGGVTCSADTSAPLFKSLNSPEGLCSSIRIAVGGSHQGLVVPSNAAFDNLASSNFYILLGCRLNSNTVGGFLFNKASSNHRLIFNTGYTLQFDLFWTTGSYSFQTIPIAGAVGANDWVIMEFTYNTSTPASLGIRTAASGAGISSTTKAATDSHSGSPKTDVGQNTFLMENTGGTATLDGDMGPFYIARTLPSAAGANNMFYYLRGLLGA